MKNTRKLLAVLLAVSVLGLYFQPIAEASSLSSSTRTRDGYNCTYAISVTNQKANASLTASKNSGALANPLTAQITAWAITLSYPSGKRYDMTKTQFDNGMYIACNTAFACRDKNIYRSFAYYNLNGSQVGFFDVEIELH